MQWPAPVLPCRVCSRADQMSVTRAMFLTAGACTHVFACMPPSLPARANAVEADLCRLCRERRARPAARPSLGWTYAGALVGSAQAGAAWRRSEVGRLRTLVARALAHSRQASSRLVRRSWTRGRTREPSGRAAAQSPHLAAVYRAVRWVATKSSSKRTRPTRRASQRMISSE